MVALKDFLWKSLKLRPGFVNQVSERIETDASINQVEKQLQRCLSAASYTLRSPTLH